MTDSDKQLVHSVAVPVHGYSDEVPCTPIDSMNGLVFLELCLAMWNEMNVQHRCAIGRPDRHHEFLILKKLVVVVPGANKLYDRAC
jgi:hypothetical protein